MGFGRLTIYNATHLHYSQISVYPCPMIDAMSFDDPCGPRWGRIEPTLTKTREVIDEFWIVKQSNRWPTRAPFKKRKRDGIAKRTQPDGTSSL